MNKIAFTAHSLNNNINIFVGENFVYGNFLSVFIEKFFVQRKSFHSRLRIEFGNKFKIDFSAGAF